MSKLLLDTNIVSYLMKAHSLAEVYRPQLAGHTLAISFMTVGELYEGAHRAAWGTQKLDRLRLDLRAYLVIPATPAVCEQWGEIRALRRAQPISPDDGWIAACARAYGLPLVTHNPGDFAGIDRLQVITEQKN